MRTLRGICGALFLIAAGSAGAGAEDYLRIELKGKKLTPELEAAIVRVVKPSAATAALAKAAKRAKSLKQFCAEIGCTSQLEAAVAAAAEGRLPDRVAQVVLHESTGAPKPDTTQTVVPSVRVPTPSPSGEPPQNYLIVRRGENVFSTLNEVLARAGLGENEIAVVPVPANETALKPDAVEPRGALELAVGAAVLENQAGAEIATLEKDLRTFGATAQTIPLDPDASPADIEAVRRLVAEENGSVTASDNPRPDVDIIWPIRQTTLSDPNEDNECKDDHKHWPYNAVRIKDILAFDLAVLAAMGQPYPRRSNILVIDSGIAPALTQLQQFRPFLFADARELLNAGHYYKGTDTSPSGLVCDDADGEAYGVAFGNVPEAEWENRKLCDKDDLTELLSPPAGDPNVDPGYIPEHGGFVGAIASGGLDLMAMRPEIALDSLVGVSFARIMWANPSNSPARSSPADVARAFTYAAKKRIDVVNASLTIKSDPNKKLAEAIDEFKDQDGGRSGLLVAAAGNIEGEPLQSSSVFPASMASEEGDDQVLLVGGLKRTAVDREQVEFFPSSWSPQLVDIAAPAADIASFDMKGERICKSGTSAAAPQVSFIAGVLRALGLRSAGEIKRRILATAELSADLTGRVRSGRQLNAVNALDVFVDLLWLKGATTPIRVQLKSPADNIKPVILPACAEADNLLKGDKGWIDVGRLLSWRRVDGNKVEIWLRTENGAITPLNKQCEAASGEFKLRFYDLVNRRGDEKKLSEIDRLVPSQLRAALPAARKIIEGQ